MNQVLNSKIEMLIYSIRGKNVMLDRDLAQLYGVETRTLNQVVKRNISRFPPDFRFQLSDIEEESLISQIVISKKHKGGHRKKAFTYTELGIAMLSSVLRSETAIQVNISIMRSFFRLRHLLKGSDTLAEKIQSVEDNSNQLFKIVFERLDTLETEKNSEPSPSRRKIGI